MRDRHVFGARLLPANIQRRSDPLMAGQDQPDPRVTLLEVLEHQTDFVLRSVIDRNEFEVTKNVIEKALKGCRQIGAAIEDGHHDADARFLFRVSHGGDRPFGEYG